MPLNNSAKYSLCILITVFLSLVTPASAQNVIGETTMNGRPLQLLDDNTWRFTDLAPGSSATACSTVNDVIQFCGLHLGWEVASKMSPEAQASFDRGGREFILVISEPLGSDQGMSLPGMRKAVVYNFAVGAGIAEADVDVYSTQAVNVLGHTGETVTYGGVVNNIPVIYISSYWVENARTTQFINIFLDSKPQSAFYKTHRDALASLKAR